MKLLTRRAAPFLLVFALLFAAAPRTRVKAWGPSGHRIVALVATKHLSKAARKKVKKILDGQTLADVANWADDEREERPETAKWHFVNLPRNATGLVRSRDCPNTSDGEPGCAVTAIEKFAAVLSNNNASDDDRAEALKFIVHFVGDLHQPLHVSFKDNRGGNDIQVKFFGKQSNLHKVWDSGIINRAGLSEEEFANELEATLRDETGDEEFGVMSDTVSKRITQIQSGTLDDWTNESFALAVRNAYDDVPTNGTAKLGQDYYDTNWLIVDRQLIRGGLRLARILNDVLK